MFDVLFNHLSRHVPGTADKVTTCPEVLAPIAFLKFRVLHLELSGGFTFEIFYQGGDVGGGIDGDEHMHVVWGHSTREYFGTFLIANATQQLFGTLANIAFEYFVSVLRDPTDMEIDGEHRV